MLNDDELARLMTVFLSGQDQKDMVAMLEDMDDEDKVFFKGYIAGYVEAFSQLNAALSSESENQ